MTNYFPEWIKFGVKLPVFTKKQFFYSIINEGIHIVKKNKQTNLKIFHHSILICMLEKCYEIYVNSTNKLQRVMAGVEGNTTSITFHALLCLCKV